MQELLDTVRATGAQKCRHRRGPGLGLRHVGFPEGEAACRPNGNGVIYANHAYPFKGDTVERWIAKMESRDRIPVIVSEFGSEPEGGARTDRASSGCGRCCRLWRTTGGTGRPGTCIPMPALA